MSKQKIPFIVDDLSKQKPFGDIERAPPVSNPSTMLDGWRESLEGLKLEKAIGRYVTVSAALLQALANRRRSVARVVAEGVDFENSEGEWRGTGFLVSKNLFLTNHHVINSFKVAQQAWIEFDYEISIEALLLGDREIAPSFKRFRLDPSRLFVTSPVKGGLDYTIIWIDQSAAAEFGHIPLERASFTVKENEQAFVIHHPDGRLKEASLDDTDIVGLDSKVLHYSSDTEAGSSGAPIFDRQGRLIALHHASKEKDATTPDGKRLSVVNEGIKIAAIALDLETRSQRSGADATMAREVLSVIGGSDSLTGFFGGLGRHESGATDVERVVNTYQGDDADIDIGFWNIEHLSTRYEDEAKLSGAARVIADMKLDAWGLIEVSPTAIDKLTKRLKTQFGEDYDYALSEPNSGDKQSTAMIWRTKTLEGGKTDWPSSVEPLFHLDSRDPNAPGVEAIHGKIFNRYPGLFKFRTKANGAKKFTLHIVPVHLKAMSEGSLRRRMASAILRRALDALRGEGVSDVILGGDVNAPLAGKDFKALMGEGYVALGAEDEEQGSFTYLKSPKSLIDNIFLSPNLSRTFGADDFMIVAKERSIGDFVQTISDHRPIMLRLSIAELAAQGVEAPETTIEALLDAAQGMSKPAKPLRSDETVRPKTEPAALISFAELKRRLRDPSIPDHEIAPFLTAREGLVGAFDPRVTPNPSVVRMDDDAAFEVESAIGWGNAMSRWRRRQRFEMRLALGEKKPVLVSEGDSWFQFPLLIDDVVDHLNEHYLICSLDAAGDTADNMVKRNPEYMLNLVAQKANGVAGFLFSAAGNDVIGADETGRPALARLLKPYTAGKSAAWHINTSELRKTLAFLEDCYSTVIATVRGDPDFKRLPIFIHGYDYAIPGGFPGDPRRPAWAAVDEWLGSPMKDLRIVDPDLQTEIIRKLIDALYDMLERIAGSSARTHVIVVDARGALGPVTSWADEIHGTSEGFRSVAARFKARIDAATAGR